MKLDRNGYRESLFSTSEDECYLCGRCVRVERHEIFGGANRSNSKRYGLWINVCPNCHRTDKDSIHLAPEKHTDLKIEAQQLFEEAYIDKDFMSIFGRNYL